MPHIREIMTHDPITLSRATLIVEAAQKMKECNIGDVLVMDGAAPCGIVTDRDIVIRAIAESRDPATTRLGDICSMQLITITADEDVEAAVELMRTHAIRRIPVMEGGRPIGIVSLGDLAIEREPRSCLGQVSQAPAQH